MKLGFNQATALKCKGQSLMADMQACEKYGFDYIEIRLDSMQEYLKNGGSLEALASWFKSHKLKPWAFNTLEFFNLRDEKGTKEIDELIDFMIEVCNAIDMKMIITVPTFDVGDDKTIEFIKEGAVARLTEIANKLDKHGIRISLEFCGVPTCSINQFGTAYDVVKKINKANVGITLDTFHFHAMGSKWEDLEKADANKIFAYHLNDTENLPIGIMRDNHRLWPGEGALDHERTLNILKKIGFNGVCTVEEFRPEYYEMNHDDNVRVSKEKTVQLISKYYDIG